MTALTRRRPGPLRGTLRMPGDKSISHRALLLSALAEGRSTITGLNEGDDVGRTAAALRACGVAVARLEPRVPLEVEGSPLELWSAPPDVVDAGNSGSTARMLAGLAAGIDGLTVITGDATLRRRPMLRVVAPLRSMGATIEGRDHGDRLPLAIRGARLTGIEHESPIASAQVKTCLLLAGLNATGQTSVTEPITSRDHTERMMAAAGIDVTVGGTTVGVSGGSAPRPVEWHVPGDISSALFFIVAASLIAGSELTIDDVGLNPTRTGGVDILRAMGADLDVRVEHTIGGEPIGRISARASELHGIEVAAEQIPASIDEIPVLAIAAARAEGTTVFNGIGELRAKESDRASAIAEGLSALGGTARVDGDRLVVEGPSALEGGQVESYGDHRIAMAFAIAGLVSAARVKVGGWSCVDTSFPGFLDVLGQARGRRS